MGEKSVDATGNYENIDEVGRERKEESHQEKLKSTNGGEGVTNVLKHEKIWGRKV